MPKGKMRRMSICLSDIPKEKIVKASANNKLYLSLTTWDNDEPDKYDNDFSVSISKTKEEVEAKAPTVYIGNGRIMEYTPKQPVQATAEEVDDLPF